MVRTLREVQGHPVFQALNPEGKHFMEAYWLPECLNPFTKRKIRIAALIPSGFPHIKTVPAFQMLWDDFQDGVYEDKHTLVVPSSGNTAHAVARLARAYGLEVKAVVASDVPGNKLGVLKDLGLGADFVSAGDVERGTRDEIGKPGCHHLDQYSHPSNPLAHELYTGPEIARVLLGTNLKMVAIALGSGGTACGVGRYFALMNPQIRTIGVRPKLGDRVPGARDEKKMKEVVRLPWRGAVSGVVEVGQKESFIAMRELWSGMGPQPGPTSGMARAGLCAYLRGLGSQIDEFEDSTVAFICPDDSKLYSDVTIRELDPDQGVI